MIPPFEASGNLPPGVYTASWQEFATAFGTTPHRRALLVGLQAAPEALRAAGCRRVYSNGSFVTVKRRPHDFDGCWDMEGVDPDQLDPILLTFDRGRAAQKAKYRGELLPAQFTASASGATFLAFFQQDKDGIAKGIIAIDLQESP